MTYRKFKNMGMSVSQYAPNHMEIEVGGNTYFTSYNSVVACKDKEGVITIGKDWDYSKTTLKYLGAWLGKNKAGIQKAIDEGEYNYEH